ncbi:MAG: hypothetical protein WC934_01895, partial [Acidithiobacillus sp.]
MIIISTNTDIKKIKKEKIIEEKIIEGKKHINLNLPMNIYAKIPNNRLKHPYIYSALEILDLILHSPYKNIILAHVGRSYIYEN